MKKVLTVGVYDLLHIGHVELFRKAKALGDYLIVAVQDSDVVLKFKPEAKMVYSTEERCYMVRAIRYVDEVIPEYTWEQKIKDVVDNQVDVFVMGDDWAGQFDFLKDYCEVVYLPRTEGISTTKIKNDLHK